MPAAILIPARFASTRFPGKPLARQTGKFLIQHVVEQAGKARRAQCVIVATDDSRIMDAVESFGGRAVLTRDSHISGTDRIAEAMAVPEFAGFNTVVNLQGDEPEIDPELIDALIAAVEDHDIPVATASAAFDSMEQVSNPNMVKVVVNRRQEALYFSRSAIPFDRDGVLDSTPETQMGQSIYRKHLGIYAYRRSFLLQFAAAPPCALERVEKLEQLRALDMGAKIHVVQARHAAHGIDTPEDYAAFVARWKKHAAQ